MIDKKQEGVYTMTGAFNLIKDLLGLPRTVFIKKSLFVIIFDELEPKKYYLIKRPEEYVKKMFEEKRIRDFNDACYQFKQEGKLEEAEKISMEALMLVDRAMKLVA